MGRRCRSAGFAVGTTRLRWHQCPVLRCQKRHPLIAHSAENRQCDRRKETGTDDLTELVRRRLLNSAMAQNRRKRSLRQVAQ